MIKEIKYGGYTAQPSGYECPDGELSMSVNMVPEKSAMRMVMPPKKILKLADGIELIAIHHADNTSKHYIFTKKDSGDNKYHYYWLADSSITTYSDTATTTSGMNVISNFTTTERPSQVTSVGNTLVVLANDGLHYVLWQVDSYKYLGQKVPELKISWGLNTRIECYPKNTGDNATTHASPSKVRGTVNQDTVYLPFVSDTGAWVPPKPVWEQMGVPASWEGSWTYSVEHLSGDKGDAGIHAWADIITNLAMGAVNKFVGEYSHRKGGFVHPFFVRWAYELYDGKLVMHSDPVLLIPNSKSPFFALDAEYGTGFELEDQGDDNVGYTFRGRAYGFVGELTSKIVSDASVVTALRSDWKDIVSSVNIYVSAPVYLYKQSERVWGWTNMDDNGAWDGYFTEGNFFPATGSITGLGFGRYEFADKFQEWNEASDADDYDKRYFIKWKHDGIEGPDLPSYILTMPTPTAEEMQEAVGDIHAFYKVASWDIDSGDFSGGVQKVKIDEGVLESLLARDAMKDDYHSRDIIKADRAFTYNGRVNLTGISRYLHSPLSPDIAWPMYDLSSTRSWTVAVEMKDGSVTTTVVSGAGINGTDFPRYVSYPNSKAVSMTIGYTENSVNHFYKLKLKENSFLEMAYWYGGLSSSPGTNTDVTDVSSSPFPTASANRWTNEQNKMYSSEKDNPHYFPLSGINTVGTGRILGVCSAVKALSEGQFGQFPLYAFTTEGVWALEVTKDGMYTAKQPTTRDVCTNADSITQTDDSVLFTTDRGIMLISGSNSVCISEAIDTGSPFAVSSLPGLSAYLSTYNPTDSGGDTKVAGIITAAPALSAFRSFLSGCKMLYDYEKQRIYVYNPTAGYAYVYSLDTKAWGMAANGMQYGVNSYPDALAVIDGGSSTTIITDVAETDWTKDMQGLIVTRPLKLDSPDVLKTVDTVIQRGYFDTHNTYMDNDTAYHVKKVRQILYGSRDLINWHLVYSSTDEYLRGFRGTPYKYFRVVTIVNLRESESVIGCTVQHTPRLTDQPR